MMFREQWDAAGKAGFDRSLINVEKLQSGNAAGSVALLTVTDSPLPAIYRGWMLRAERYTNLHNALSEKGYIPLVSAEAYESAHHVTGWIDALSEITPRTYIGSDWQAWASENGVSAGIVRDFVKSRKHEWDEACFIPALSDHAAAQRVIDTFRERQGDNFVGALVLREFVDLREVGRHPKSGIALMNEWRLFVMNGKARVVIPYWGDLQPSDGDKPSDEIVRYVTERVSSPFYSADFAQLESGDWTLIEVGDGQVSGLPDGVDVDAFYRELADAFNTST